MSNLSSFALSCAVRIVLSLYIIDRKIFFMRNAPSFRGVFYILGIMHKTSLNVNLLQSHPLFTTIESRDIIQGV